MNIYKKSKKMLAFTILATTLLLPTMALAIEPVPMPAPASAHTIIPYYPIPAGLEKKAKDALAVPTHAGTTDPTGNALTQNKIDTIVGDSIKTTTPSTESTTNPYLLEKQYALTKDPRTVPANSYVRTQTTTPRIERKVTRINPVKRNPQDEQRFLATTMQPAGENSEWQASKYKFSPTQNIITYPKDSPLKMITLQFFVEISDGFTIAKKAKLLLEKINNALPNAVLIVGLRELSNNTPLYVLSQWKRDAFSNAIKKISSRMQRENIGANLRDARTSLLNIPTPASFVLITDGEDSDINNLQFDLKLFYAPDPRFPLNVVSFARTKKEQKTIELIKAVHKGSFVFDGQKLLDDSAYFTQFMKTLFVK